MTTKTDYNAQAQAFLNKTGAKITVKYNRTGKYFDGDKDERDIYDVTITRGSRSYTFTFGQSVNASGRWVCRDGNNSKHNFGQPSQGIGPKHHNPGITSLESWAWIKNPNFAEPNAYDILSAFQKSDPGTFDDFCADFGYDTDSIKAHKTYEAVRDEYLSLSRLFTDSEMEAMQEIS